MHERLLNEYTLEFTLVFTLDCSQDADHRLLCMNERVPCINASNGCPAMLPRRTLARHLEHCPASVVFCTMEWNRWPVGFFYLLPNLPGVKSSFSLPLHS